MALPLGCATSPTPTSADLPGGILPATLLSNPPATSFSMEFLFGEFITRQNNVIYQVCILSAAKIKAIKTEQKF